MLKPNLIAAFLLFVSAVTVANSQTSPPVTDFKVESAQEGRVREFVAAFNAHDSGRMLEMADENIQWVGVDGVAAALASVKTENSKALRETMDGYFKRCPSCKSYLEWIQSAGSRVTTLERAEWTTKSGLKTQKSLAVYEFRAGKIWRVYYFPAETTAN